jgi:hypothetical protein
MLDYKKLKKYSTCPYHVDMGWDYLFEWLGKKWIENKFSAHLDQLRHQHALEIQKLKVEIDAMLSGALKLQEKEFSILPEAWAKLDEAHSLVCWLVSPLQQYADVNGMNDEELEEFLVKTELSESQKKEVRFADDKNRTYQAIAFWHRLHKVKTAFSSLKTFIAKNGIFLTPELEDGFSKIADLLYSAVVSKEVGHEAMDWKMQTESWAKIKDEADPLYKKIKSGIQNRLQSHAHAN